MHLSPDQFRDLVIEHQSMVYSIALRLLGDPQAAEETAQDVFLELYRALARIDSTQHLVHWLRRVAVHRATDSLRRRLLRPEALAEEWTEWTETAAPQPSGTALVARLEQMLQSLPIPLRTAIVLRYQEDLTPPEIAALLDQPLPTVQSNLQRALALLRRKAQSVLKEYVRA
jgi:RNA polymerase sigma-70 factor (ECF subfamily)